MKKHLFLSFLLGLLCMSTGLYAHDIAGNGSTGTVSVSDLSGAQFTSIDAGESWVMTLDVENSDGKSYNQWGTSIIASGSNAFPEKNNFQGLQLYLQSSTNGGKLDAVFSGSDHVISNVTYQGNFQATIVYDGDKSLIIETVNANGTKGENRYTMTTALPAISEFAYGLPTGINVKATLAKITSTIDCPTPGVANGGKMHFTSGKMYYAGECNKLRFTLTESGAFYSNGAKRMSFDSFTLYNANGDEVKLEASQFDGNNSKSYANMLDGTNSTYCCGTWSTSGATDDYFEILLTEDLGGAFSFAFVTENTTMNAKAFRIEALNDVVTEYTLAVDAPAGNTVSLRYDGQPVSAGDALTAAIFNADLLSANDIPGYVWSVVVDDEAMTVTVRYSRAEDVENPASVVALVERIGGKGAAGKFSFLLSPSMNSRQEVFVIGADGGKIFIKGNTISAITTGLGWYLNNHANINIAWNSLNEKAEGEAYADLSSLPLPTAEETHLSDAQYRYYLNYCTFGYSMTTWTWKRWQQEIDWMALHGINMPLQIVGLEEVWRRFLTMEEGGTRKYNYTDQEAKAFVPGPAFTAWWGMNNLEGWGGTGNNGWSGVQDDAWYARQATLAKSIVERQRELGMHPVLPGFSGMVPSNFTTKTGVATDANGGSWCGFTRPRIIDPTATRFAEIAADYYACLKDVMGESQYYSMDPFHEGGSISSGKYSEAYTAIYNAMEKAKQGSQWVIQQWQWSRSQALSLNAVPAGKLVVLDLFSDGRPAFNNYNGYAPQHAVFCAIPNFGGRSGLMGRLNNVTDNYFMYKEKFASVKGIGAAPEAIEQTPVTYDLIFQLPWMGSKPDMKEWVRKYANARYGTDNTTVQEAWELLRQGVLNYGADAIQGPVEDVWAARPNLNASPASTWGVTLNSAGGTYTRARRQMLIDATYKILGEKDALTLASGSTAESNYLYDIVEFGGAVMADYAYDLLLGIKAAKEAAGDNFATDPIYIARRDAFLALIADMDTFKGTNLNFRLGKWTQEARDAAAEVTGAATATADWYEFNNARTLITTWGDQSQNGGLKDYSYRSWQGLLKDYYLPRWQYFFDHGCQGTNYFFFEWNWAHGMQHSVGQTAKNTTRLTEGQAGYSYSRTPEGNTIDEAHRILDKYIMPIRTSDGTYYAYSYLDNDLSGKITIVANAGDAIDLTKYLPGLTNATVSGDFIDGKATDLSCIRIKSDAADGNHTGIVSLANGTKITFSVVLNPAYYGTYHINYKDGGKDAPVFIAYNEDEDNSKNKGYKMIATGTYTADAPVDAIFTLAPCGGGYSISAQGQYLKAPTLGGWNHIMFSKDANEAGSYLIEETETADVFKIRNTGSGINYVNDYDKGIFGNDNANKPELSTFTIVPVDKLQMTVSTIGYATLCMPFNVVMPEGMQAFDCAASDITRDDEEDVYICTMKAIANPGETLKAGTPVIVKAAGGDYQLAITMNNDGTRSSLSGSLLRGNYVKQNLVQGDVVKKFIFMKPEGQDLGFYRMQETGTIAANRCWMEWAVPTEMAEARRFILHFSGETGINDITATNSSNLIYNLNGQRLSTPQKGVNIIGNTKVIIK